MTLMKTDQKNVAFLLFPEAEELDFAGPWEVFNVWRAHADGAVHCYTVAETKGPVMMAKGLGIVAEYDFENCPPPDVLVAPGGWGTRREVDNIELIDFIRRSAAGCEHVLSICTGAFLLHAAGLLAGKRATTHWGSLDRLRALGDVEVVEERWVRDGNVWTSAGVSAGLDLALAFVADAAGDDAASRTQMQAEFFPEGVRYGDRWKADDAPCYLAAESPKSRASE